MLNEVKLSDLNNTRIVNNIRRLQQTAHSQGYDVSDKQTHGKYGSHSTVEIRHRKTGESVKKARWTRAGGKDIFKGNGHHNPQHSRLTLSETMSDPVAEWIRDLLAKQRGKQRLRLTGKPRKRQEIHSHETKHLRSL